MAQIDKPNLHFNTKLYTGTGSNQAITGVGFQPDLIWWKCRNVGKNHGLTDAVRGNTKIVRSNSTNTEDTASDYVQSFDSDGFTAGSNGNMNSNGDTFCSWNWKGNGSGSSNSNGSITSTVSANTTSGFSIVTYTGAGGNGSGTTSTVGHGLGAKPKVIILKSRTSAWKWVVYHEKGTPNNNQHLQLQGSNAVQTSSYNYWNTSGHTTNTFGLGEQSDTNSNGENFIAYCFAEKKGFSKFGSYTGNGNADGTFVYTGFKPAWVLTKETSNTSSWDMHDNKRDSYNVCNKYLLAEDSGAEGTTDILDFYSNGFKFRTTNGDRNESGATYIYMAFAENPIVGSNDIPATAR